jgi:hypothetical protein
MTWFVHRQVAKGLQAMSELAQRLAISEFTVRMTKHIQDVVLQLTREYCLLCDGAFLYPYSHRTDSL